MEDDAELLLERVEEEMAEEYSEEEDGLVVRKIPEKCLESLHMMTRSGTTVLSPV